MNGMMDASSARFKILLVDDHEENLLALEAILEGNNYELVRATSGAEALSHLLKDPDFHLIIMDVLMPAMNGFETAEVIYSREKLRNIPIIFLTAMDIEGNVYKGYKAGAIDYIRKPIFPELLRVKVQAFVELSEKTKALQIQEKKLMAINEKLEKEIAERKLSEKKIMSLNKDLAHRLTEVQSLDSFSYSISHDLMSPINSIKSLAGFLLSHHEKELSDQAKEVVQLVLKSSDKMSDLIKNLLTFSKHTNAILQKNEQSMSNLVHGVMEELSINNTTSTVDLVIHPLPPAKCDGNMIKQVWSNLLSNAIKYSQKKKQPRVEVGGVRENGSYHYFVKDNGTGFDMRHYNKLFGIFQRLHHDGDYEGSGIGLAIVKRIVERHGGKVWAESAPSKGSCFYFSLPAE